MPRLKSLTVPAILLFLDLSALGGCRTKAAPAHVPAQPNTDVMAAERLAQGDALFQEAHLYAWRKAEEAYRQAYELQHAAPTKEKLMLTRFLIMSRQMDEDIPDSRQDDTVKDLCADPSTPKDRLLCALAMRYRRGIWLKLPVGQAPAKIQAEAGMFDFEHSPADAYLYSVCIRSESIDSPPEKPAAAFEAYKDSPFFIYLDLAKRGIQKLGEVEKTSPQFAEMFDYMGEELFQRKRYNGAKTYFRKALGLIPDYTRSMNGLGNIYTYVVEDYEKAIEYYDAALKYDPRNTAAFFGKGVALHNLGKHEDSNAVLDSMFLTDISRRGYASDSNMRYYQGEGYHLQAYNHYLMKNAVRARELVNQAKKFLPDSEEVNYLSGLLYFEENNMEAARGEFLKVIQRGGSNCSAQRYLGLIYHARKGIVDKESPPDSRMPRGGDFDKLKKSLDERFPDKDPGEKRALNYFLRSCSCMDTAVKGLGDQIKSVPSLDLDEAEKVVLRGRLEQKLFDYRLSSKSMIESMLKVLADDEIEGKQNYLDLMNEILSRVAPPGTGK
jgi:tetratricopeptide (TPR) repeat protein